MKELGWILVGLILGIPFNYFINLTTPALGVYLKNRSLSRRERKIKVLLNSYEIYKGYKADPSSMLLALVSLIAGGLAVLGIMFVFSSVIQGDLFKIFTLLLLWALCFMANRMITAVQNVRDFDKFKERVVKELVKLGGNPEDLEKQETSVDSVTKKSRKVKAGS